MRPSLKARNKYSGSNLSNVLNQGDTAEDLSTCYVICCFKGFKIFLRMTSADFEYLLGQNIGKRDTTFRDAIPIREKFAVTLRFMAASVLTELKLPI